MVGSILSAIVALSLVAIGTGALVAPQASAVQYGLVLDDPRSHAFIRAMGVRDLAIGLLFALLLQADARELLAWSMTAVATIPVGDFLIVTHDRRTHRASGRDGARLLHAAGAVGLLATAALLHAGG